MKSIAKFATTASVLAVMATGASAATYTFTEGNGQNRKLVAGSTDLNDSPVPDGIPLGSFANDDVIQLHGRIVSSQDVFTYTFAFASAFKVEFDLDGYELATDLISSDGVSTFETISGLVGQVEKGGNPETGSTKKAVAFTLARTGSSVTKSFTTDVWHDNPSDGFIFSGLGGFEYTLTVDGSLQPTQSAVALYDLKISAVPIPAAGFMLLGGLGGLAALRRRKGKAQG
ncbi:MAG: VPLPA-CTERM sorting domain-containing protein [Tateyamaria sp.]|uniref:VPLPA-CTERM sorting domain-containing protein n=1 Tax=Tateyamaria sp. TaxID=1929288 RepID=UPI0032783C2C